MNNQDIIVSYQNNFKSPIGAYVYMMLNQNIPEFFVLSSSKNENITAPLENILLNAIDLSQIIAEIKDLPEELFTKLEVRYTENDLTKRNLLKLTDNMKYIATNWNTSEAWQELNGFIDYNGYSAYIDNKSDLQEKLKEYATKFSFGSLSLNPNFKPLEFLTNLETGINLMCETLDISPKQIGLNVLNVNYKTEAGDFTGYVNNDDKYTPDNQESYNKMVINSIEVFAHEWLHFIENSLGLTGRSLTEIMDLDYAINFKSFIEEYENIYKFKEIVNSKNSEYNEHNLSTSVKSTAYFFERFALDSTNYYENIEKIAVTFEENYKEGKSKETCLDTFEKSIEALLQKPHPTRYFSFLKAQCELYITKMNEEKLETNQFVDFSKKSDEYLKLDNYTESTVEVFARSFESFLHDKIQKQGKECSILSSSYKSDFYPQAKVRTELNSFWDKMWPQLKKGIDTVMPKDKPLPKIYMAFDNISKLREKYYDNNGASLKNNL